MALTTVLCTNVLHCDTLTLPYYIEKNMHHYYHCDLWGVRSHSCQNQMSSLHAISVVQKVMRMAWIGACQSLAASEIWCQLLAVCRTELLINYYRFSW